MTDGELLRRYVRDHSEASFEELVKRHINLIYSAALRQVNGDVHLAEDVTQSVFTDLARKAAKLAGHTSLTGWLYTSTRFVAANLRRTGQRRSGREQEVHAMNAILNPAESEPDWVRVRPLLDEAMHGLDAEDRQAVLMRHFENRSYAEIGASIGLSENAARMRVERALEKLRGALTKRGVTSTAMALAGLLAVNAVGAAPAYLAARVASAALTGATTVGGAAVLLSHLLAPSKTKLALGAAAAALIATLTVMVVSRHENAGTSEPPDSAAAPTGSNVTVAAMDVPRSNAPAVISVPPLATTGPVLHLEIVTADTGRPISSVPIDYRAWAGGKFHGKQQLTSDRFGICEVAYPANTTELELTTHKEDFADTQLLWRPPNGEIIPTNYVLRIDRPVPIGGRVVDADGNPVAGAKVGWNHQDDPTAVKLPQSHHFGWIETITDQDGRWRINQIAEDMIPLIYGSARNTNYVDSGLVFAGSDKAVEQQLREGTHVFKLGRAITVKGIVTDADGTPVPEAKILVGYNGMSDRRNGKSQGDGTFSVGGCRPGKQLVSAEAAGFAATTLEVDLQENGDPIRLILKPGKTLRLRVLDKSGNPIPKANIFYVSLDQGMPDPDRPKSVQAEFGPTTDQEGRATWLNAPDAEMEFDALAPGFLRVDSVKIRPDDKEHVITLPKALVVHGVVSDKATGQRVPKFRIALGWPDGTNAQWSSIGRFWLDFTGGDYHHSFEEGVVYGTENPGYILKFIAEGYAPFISRAIGPDEGDVELNVTLRPAVATTVSVYNSNGQPATDADIGLVSPGARLSLIEGGFSHENVQSGGSLLRTGSEGTFTLQPDDSVTRVIAASSAGYAEATPAALSAGSVLQLQPWGRLEVTCNSNGKPIAGRQFNLDFGGGALDTISFGFAMSQVTTDAQGQFSLAKLPPGHHTLVRLYPYNAVPGGGGWMTGGKDSDKTAFEIRPGETTSLNLDGTN